MIITGTYNLKLNPSWSLLQLQEIYLECDTTLIPVTINLFEIKELNGYKNVKIYISDISNNAGTNNIVINTGGLDCINTQGITNFVLNQNGSCCILSIMNETKWSALRQTYLVQTGLTYKGAWDANSNTPTLTSGVGTAGDYYIVSVAGNTNLDGVIDWQVGDWAIFEGTTNMWQKIDNHDVQAYNTIQEEGFSLPQRSIIDFVGPGVSAFDNGAKTTVFVPGVSAGNFGLYSQTASSTPITNTVAETSLLDGGVGTLSVPANGFSIGDSFLAVMTGHLSCSNNQQLQIRIKSNGSLLADTGIITLNTATNRNFNLQIYFTIRTLGLPGVASIVTGGNFAYTKNASTTLEGTTFSSINNVTFNTTVLNTLVISAQWGAANTNNIIYSDIFTLTKTY
jgi:hypothetical protein